MMSLSCRQKFVDIKTVYADPEEAAKATSYAPALAISKRGVDAGSGRVKNAKDGGHLKPWKGEPPSKAELIEQFGKFHYGWTDRPSLDTVEPA